MNNVTKIALAIMVASTVLLVIQLHVGSTKEQVAKQSLLEYAHQLRKVCKPHGMGVEQDFVGYNSRLYATEIFACPDGTIGYLPVGFGL